MGTYNNGILGAFKGKVGNVVGSTWNGVKYMRAVPVSVKDPKTEKQLAQRQRFGLMTSFMRKFRPVVNIGFRKGAGNMSASNRAASYNIKNAVDGEYPDQEIRFDMLRFSRGDLTGSYNASAVSANTGELTITWADNTGDGSASPDDTLVVSLYSAERDSVFFRVEAAERQDGTVSIALPESYHGDTVETYIFFVSADEEQVSDSDYLGSIPIQDQE